MYGEDFVYDDGDEVAVLNGDGSGLEEETGVHLVKFDEVVRKPAEDPLEMRDPR